MYNYTISNYFTQVLSLYIIFSLSHSVPGVIFFSGREGGEKAGEALLPGKEEKNGASTADATNGSENKKKEVTYTI